jgi:cytochrome c556
MKLKLAVAVAALSVGLAGMAVGQDSPIPARQEIMKMNGAAMKKVGAMVKGETPYNATEAADAMKLIADNMEEFPSFFPAGSDQGDTKAGPAIWTDTAGFQAAAAKLVTDAKAAQEAAAGGLDGFTPAFEQVGSNCGGCHKIYRK